MTILDRVTPDMVEWEPFPHVVVREPVERAYADAWLDDDDYDRFPTCRADNPFAHRLSAGDWDLGAGGTVSELMAPHVRGEFFYQVACLFDVDPCRLICVRGHAGGQEITEMDCQFVENPPDVSLVRDPHVDNPREIYAGLWYLRHPDDKSTGGHLVLYEKTVDRVTFHRSEFGKGSVTADQIRPVKTIPYEHNVLVFFLNTRDSIHGVTPRENATMPRRYVNFIAESPKPRFEL